MGVNLSKLWGSLQTCPYDFVFWDTKGTNQEMTRKEKNMLFFAKQGVYGTILANFNTNLECKGPELCTDPIV